MTTTITGTLSGGVIPVGPNQQVMVCVEGLDGAVVGCDAVAPTETSYSIAAQWGGSATRQVRLHALQVERDVAGYPVSYPGYATMTATLTDSVPTVANLDLGTALPTTTVDVGIDASAAVTATLGAVQLGPNLSIPVMMVSSAATSHVALMPELNGAPFTFAAVVGFQHLGWEADVTGTTATVAFPALPTLVSPASGATGITNTTAFTASNPTDGPLTFTWEITGGPKLAVTTMATSHSMPDPTPFGLTIPASAAGSWMVDGSSGPSPEHGAGGVAAPYNVFYMVLLGGSPGLEGSGTFAQSDVWTYTTAP
jgi:hypothetical protein